MKKIALLGNPNTGKTSLFNQLTGSRQYVGNWSGVTVEKKVGKLKNGAGSLIDLPGIYSLSPLSPDEAVVTKFFLHESFEEYINVLDAAQLERNLHLTLQMADFNRPKVIVLNMVDVARRRNINIDVVRLSEVLGCAVIPVVARTKEGILSLLDFLDKKHAKASSHALPNVKYGATINDAVNRFGKICPNSDKNGRWLLLQMIEGNTEVIKFVGASCNKAELAAFLGECDEKIRLRYGYGGAEYLYRCRTKAIRKILDTCTKRSDKQKTTLTEKLDRVVVHPFFGVPLFFAVMYLMFFITFDWVGTPLSQKLDWLIGEKFGLFVTQVLQSVGASPFVHSLVIDGVLAGVGGVLVFVPQVFILFFITSFLEDSGYMARVAFVMDRALEKVGLNGKSFISMIIGFGCNVPGIMVARSIETPRERLLTILVTPLMSCTARLPVYTLFVGAIFSNNQGAIVFSVYLLGIVVALLLAKLFSVTILKSSSSFFVIELPTYHLPQVVSLWKSTWEKGKGFIKRAGTYIFVGSVLVWLLSNLGLAGFGVPLSDSLFALIGKVIAPFFSPLGFGTWQAASSLLTGVLAKEAVVATMNIVYVPFEHGGLANAIASHFSTLSAYSFMVFTLIYIPCLATIATIYQETASKKWTLFSVVYSLVIAYLLSFLIFQVGKFFI